MTTSGPFSEWRRAAPTIVLLAMLNLIVWEVQGVAATAPHRYCIPSAGFVDVSSVGIVCSLIADLVGLIVCLITGTRIWTRRMKPMVFGVTSLVALALIPACFFAVIPTCNL